MLRSSGSIAVSGTVGNLARSISTGCSALENDALARLEFLRSVDRCGKDTRILGVAFTFPR